MIGATTGNGGFRPSAKGLHLPYYSTCLKPRTVRGEPFDSAQDRPPNPFVVSLSNHERPFGKQRDRPFDKLRASGLNAAHLPGVWGCPPEVHKGGWVKALTTCQVTTMLDLHRSFMR